MAELIKSVEGSMSAQGYTNTAYSIKLEVYLNSQSIEDNTSNLTYKVYLRANGNSWGWSQFTSPRTYIYRNGGLISTSNSISSLPTNNSGVWVQVQSYTEDIKHNDDGTLNINMSATFKSNTSGYRYMPKDKTISTGNFDLETIPRASEFSGMPTEFYIQDGLPISFTKYAESFTEKLTVDFPDIQTAIEVESPVSGQTIEIYSDIQQDIFNSLAYNEDSVICNLALETYSGETLIGFSLASLNAKMKPTQDTQPLITGSISTSEANTTIQSLTNGVNYIKGYSNLLIELNPIATFKYNAQLSKVLVKDTNEMEVLNDVASYTLNNVNTSSIKVSVVDTRNFSSSITATIPLIEYKEPILSEVTTSRENGVGEEVYLNFKAKLWNGNFGNGNNTITEFKYRVKEHSSSEYSEWFDLLGAVKVAIEGQSVDNLIAENIKIYSDGVSTNFEFGISYDIQVYLKDGIVNTPFNQTSYVISIIEDGYVLDSYVKSSNGYKYAINDVVDNSLAEGLQVNGKFYLNKEDLKEIIDNLILRISNMFEINTYIMTPITSEFSANQWNEIIYNYVTDTLSKGKYLLIFSFTYENGQEGSLTTTRLQIDGIELSPQTRATIPLNRKTLSGQIVTVIEFESDSTHTFNAQTYPSALLTGGCQFANCKLIKLGE